MNSKISKFLILLFVGIALVVHAEGDGKGSNTLRKTTGNPVRSFLDVSNFSTQFYNDGNSDIDPSGNSAFIFPKGSGKACVFESGFLWGAKVGSDPQVRVGGSAYRQGLQPGKILSPGHAEDPALGKNRIYRVRPDVYPGGPTVDLTGAALIEGQDAAALRTQYLTDWQEWPATDGAPYYDGNHNGQYDPDPASGDIPGVKGADQSIWFVANDLDASKTTFLYGAQPLGIEMQATFWCYAQEGALGNMLFREYKIINKSTTDFQQMYVSMWSDVDDGNSTDDYSGCDTTLSLGYTYNAAANDQVYAPLPPPAVGFDFFQGPVVASASDTAHFGGGLKPGFKNLPMTAFYYFARGDANVTDPTQGSIDGSTQFYNFFQGKVGRTGAPFIDPTTGQATTFVLTGDPLTRRGWVDGMVLPAGDRRMGLASGPFNMAVGDTQDIVVAEIVAGALPGMDRLSAVGLLKFYDQQAQFAYDNFFDLAVAPPAPDVNIAELNRQIVLDWGTNLTRVNETENYNNKGYTFEGYNVYQLPSASASLSEGRRIATYDVVNGIGKIEDPFFDTKTGVVAVGVKEFGNDTGIKRYISITSDELKGGTPLINGIKYYFAVTAYGYNANAPIHALENPIKIITVVPHDVNPGYKYGSVVGDTVKVTHSSGISEGLVLPIVIDPSKLNGHQYKVSFDTVTVYDTAGVGTVETTWRLTDVTANKVVLSGQKNLTGDDNYVTIDGMVIKVTGPPAPGMKDYEIPSGKRDWTFANADGFGLEGFEGTIGNGFANWFSSSTIGFDKLKNVLIKFANADTGGVPANTADENVSFAYRYLRGATNPPARPEFAPFIINPTAGYAYQDFVKNVYFSAWDVEANPPRRLSIGHLENNTGGGRVDGLYNPPSNNDNISNYATGGPREWFFIFDTDYSTTPNSALTVDILNTTTPMIWMGTVNRRGTNSYAEGDEFLILANHINTVADQFTFTAPTGSYSKEAAIVDINKVNVFPNPYYGVNSEELNKYNRFVTFTHLPAKATIRIFNLAGVMVKTIEKTDPNSQFQRWDLANQSGLPVASGLYIAYIDMPDLGSTKIVKVAIIQEQQILDRF